MYAKFGHVQFVTPAFDWLMLRRLPPDEVCANFNVTLSLYFASALTNGRFLCVFIAFEALMMMSGLLECRPTILRTFPRAVDSCLADLVGKRNSVRLFWSPDAGLHKTQPSIWLIVVTANYCHPVKMLGRFGSVIYEGRLLVIASKSSLYCCDNSSTFS